jgi:hypothetical protein
VVRDERSNGEGSIIETERGFIVPDDWRERAGARLHP